MYQAAPTRFDNLEFYRRCGKFRLKLPKISLGLWQNFGGASALERAGQLSVKLLNSASHILISPTTMPPRRRQGNLRPFAQI